MQIELCLPLLFHEFKSGDSYEGVDLIFQDSFQVNSKYLKI